MTTVNQNIDAVLRLGTTPDAIFAQTGPVLLSVNGFVSRRTYTPEDGSTLTFFGRLRLWLSRLCSRKQGSGSFSSKKFIPTFSAAMNRPMQFATRVREVFATPRLQRVALDKIGSLVRGFQMHMERRCGLLKRSSSAQIEMRRRIYNLEAAQRALYFIRGTIDPLSRFRSEVPEIADEVVDIWRHSGANNPRLQARILPPPPEPRHFDRATDTHQRLARRMTAGLRIDAAYEERLRHQIARARRK